MPEICRFWGLIIFMFYDEHNPPHFHATYGEYKIVIDIHTAQPIKGSFPRKQLKSIQEWCIIHKDELLGNWEAAQKRLPLESIAPL